MDIQELLGLGEEQEKIVKRFKITPGFKLCIANNRNMYLEHRIKQQKPRLIRIGYCNYADPNDLKDLIKLLIQGAPLNTHLN